MIDTSPEALAELKARPATIHRLFDGDFVVALIDALEEAREALIEATAELIYLRQYGKDGALWWANDSKDVWRDKARVGLAIKGKPAP